MTTATINVSMNIFSNCRRRKLLQRETRSGSYVRYGMSSVKIQILCTLARKQRAERVNRLPCGPVAKRNRKRESGSFSRTRRKGAHAREGIKDSFCRRGDPVDPASAVCGRLALSFFLSRPSLFSFSSSFSTRILSLACTIGQFSFSVPTTVSSSASFEVNTEKGWRSRLVETIKQQALLVKCNCY